MRLTGFSAPDLWLLFSMLGLAVLLGLGLRSSVPWMRAGLSEGQLLLLSAGAMLLFVPVLLTLGLGCGWVWGLGSQALFGIGVGVVSSYFWDGLLSSLLAGLIALAGWAWVGRRWGLMGAWLLTGGLAASLNVIGHGLTGRAPALLLGLVVVTLLASWGCARLTGLAKRWHHA